MDDAPKQKGIPKAVLIFLILGVAALIAIFVTMATVGDDVPNDLPPATATSPGN